jgi:hypothetical protein
VFESKSRYYALEQAKFTSTDGKVIVYVRRRFIPSAEGMPVLAEVAVIQGDRLDLIAGRTIGDPEQFWRICDANNAMNPFDLAAVGRTLKVPIPQF